MLREIFLVAITTMSPLVELNGGIPLGVYLGLNPLLTFLVAVFFNSIIFFPIFFLIDFFYELVFSKIRLFQKYLDKTRKKARPYVDKYGYLGLTLFIAIPSPLTGAYTGVVAAWLFSMDWKKSFLAILAGITINGARVLLAVLGVVKGLGFLLK
jgi:uncharacterized membrane protein